MFLLLQLYLSFVRIGFSSFGGMSMIPIINDEVIGHGWLTAEQVLDVVAIAEMTPGSLGINMATFCGIQVAGLPGAVCATFGTMTPSLTVCMVAAICIARLRGNRWLESLLRGIRPVSFGMLVSVVYSMSNVYAKSSQLALSSIAWNRIGLSAVLLFIYVKYKISIPKLIIIAVLLGLLFGF